VLPHVVPRGRAALQGKGGLGGRRRPDLPAARGGVDYRHRPLARLPSRPHHQGHCVPARLLIGLQCSQGVLALLRPLRLPRLHRPARGASAISSDIEAYPTCLDAPSFAASLEIRAPSLHMPHAICHMTAGLVWHLLSVQQSSRAAALGATAQGMSRSSSERGCGEQARHGGRKHLARARGPATRTRKYGGGKGARHACDSHRSSW